MNFVIHGLILRSSYEQTAQPWRPTTQTKMGLLYCAVFVSALVFSFLYGRLICNKSL